MLNPLCRLSSHGVFKNLRNTSGSRPGEDCLENGSNNAGNELKQYDVSDDILNDDWIVKKLFEKNKKGLAKRVLQSYTKQVARSGTEIFHRGMPETAAGFGSSGRTF